MAIRRDEISPDSSEEAMTPELHHIYPAVIFLNGKYEQIDLKKTAEIAQTYAESLRGVKKHGSTIRVDRNGYSYKFTANRTTKQYEMYLKDHQNPSIPDWQMDSVIVRASNPFNPEISIYTKDQSTGLMTRRSIVGGIIETPLNVQQRILLTQFLNRIKTPQKELRKV